MSRGPFRQLLCAASLANLWLFQNWTVLLTYTAANSYIMKQPPGRGNYLAALTDFALLTLALLALMGWIERSGGRKQRSLKVLFLVLLLVPLNSVRETVAVAFPLLKGDLLRVVPAGAVTAAALSLLGLTILMACLRTERLYGISRNLLLILSPAILVSTGQSLHRAFEPPERFRDKPPAQPVEMARKTTARVVWVIFDEVDGRITFRDRPADLDLPELDRLRSESVWTDRGETPSSATMFVLPALITGQLYDVRRTGSSSLMLGMSGQKEEKEWSKVQSVFTRARALGANSALAGWYHPYCRILGGQVVDCAFEDMPNKYGSVGESWIAASVGGLRALFETSLLSPFGQSLATRRQAENIERLEARALQVVSAPRIDFCFLHLQAAHAPHAYDRKTGTFTLANSPLTGYVDSLALVDRTLGRLRSGMEKAGVWDRTSLIVTSDHRYRSGRRLDGKPGEGVPLLVHLAGQKQELRVGNEVKTLGTQELVLRMLSGEVTTAEQVGEWMRRGGEFSGGR
ncbi:MAG: sulfatase-like hydrolase/transferase [Candidatus Solibacter usitatus]|nr:sulfatase-like hydrolase/transferase [Candidatus Solibacter usitatus]